MNREAAALYLGVSGRTLDNYVSAGKIKAEKIPSDKSRPVLDFAESALQKLKNDLAGTKGKGEVILAETDAPTVAETALAKVDPAMPKGNMGEFAQVLAEAIVEARAKVSIENKMLLDLEEAHQLSGLSHNDLRAALKAGELRGKKIGRGWKVQPSDLQAYISQLMGND